MAEIEQRAGLLVNRLWAGGWYSHFWITPAGPLDTVSPL